MKALSISLILILFSVTGLFAQTMTIRLIMPSGYKLNDGAPQRLILSDWDETRDNPSIGLADREFESLILSGKNEFSLKFSAADIPESCLILKSTAPIKDGFLLKLQIVICDEDNLCFFINHSEVFINEKLNNNLWDVILSLPDS